MTALRVSDPRIWPRLFLLAVLLKAVTAAAVEQPPSVGHVWSFQADPAAFCVGDCSTDGNVTVDEVLTGVNIALGNTNIGECLPFDAGGDGQVTVDEILTAVNNALNGCPVIVPTPTPSTVPTSTTTPSPNPTPTRVPKPTLTHTATPLPTQTPTWTPTVTPTPSRTRTPTPTATMAPRPPVVTSFTCNGFESCVLELDESFTMVFSFTDVNGNASRWELIARRDDGREFPFSQGSISPPSGSDTITRISPGFSCLSGNCRNTDWQIRVVITDTTGLQSLPATIDVTVLALIP